MNRFFLRLSGAFVLSLLLLPSLAAHAQSLPKPKEFYFDEDAQTLRSLAVAGADDTATQARLVKTMQRGGRDADLATAQLAHIAYRSDHAGTGAALYEKVLASNGGNSRLRLQVLWNRGWDQYHGGDAAGALGSWREAGLDRHANPTWVPPTLALALWALDRRDEALQWYAAAVRTEPAQWGNAANLPALLPEWREEDRATLAEVAAAWRAAPPAWP